jgi:hypothetical protein
MSDLEKVFDEFADATEQTVLRLIDEVRGLRAELAEVRTEQRNAPVVQPPVPAADARVIAGLESDVNRLIDEYKRLAERPAPADGKDGKDGKDAEVNIEEIVARVAEIAIPKITAAIPTPKDGENGKDGRDGRDGKDGIATREELFDITESRFAELQVRTLADSWRGVWRDGDDYTRGAVAQWDGSPWLALNDTRTKPGTSGDWVLLAKKGRDGRK